MRLECLGREKAAARRAREESELALLAERRASEEAIQRLGAEEEERVRKRVAAAKREWEKKMSEVLVDPIFPEPASRCRGLPLLQSKRASRPNFHHHHHNHHHHHQQQLCIRDLVNTTPTTTAAAPNPKQGRGRAAEDQPHLPSSTSLKNPRPGRGRAAESKRGEP